MVAMWCFIWNTIWPLMFTGILIVNQRPHGMASYNNHSIRIYGSVYQAFASDICLVGHIISITSSGHQHEIGDRD